MNEKLKRGLFVTAGVAIGAATGSLGIIAFAGAGLGALPAVVGAVGAYAGGIAGDFYADDDNSKRLFQGLGGIAGIPLAATSAGLLAPVAGITLGLVVAEKMGVESKWAKAGIAAVGALLGAAVSAVTGLPALAIGVIGGIGLGYVASKAVNKTAEIVETVVKSPFTAKQRAKEEARAPEVEQYVEQQAANELTKEQEKGKTSTIYRNSTAGPPLAEPGQVDAKHWQNKVARNDSGQNVDNVVGF